MKGFPAQGRPQGHPQRGRGGLPGRVRAPRLAAHRAEVRLRRRAPHRLSRAAIPNKYSLEMMQRLCTHPNVGAVLLVSLGCEGFNREQLRRTIAASGRPVDLLVIQQSGGTTRTLNAGLEIVHKMRAELAQADSGADGARTNSSSAPCAAARTAPAASPPIPRSAAASTGSSRTTRPASSRRPASSSAANASWPRAPSRPSSAREIEACVDKAANYYRIMGYGSFAPGNAEGGLTTLEEKSMGAYSKSGSSPISGLIKPGDVPPRGGLYLLDVVPDGEPRFGFPNISDNAEIVELIACGSHLILFTTGRGSVVGSAISPVIKVCANPDTYDRMADDMDVNAGRILHGAELDDVGREIFDLVQTRRERRAVEVRGARPPGIHPHLQTIRTDRPGLPAGRLTSPGESLETGTFWLRGRGAPRSRDRGRQHRRSFRRHSRSRGRRAVARIAEEARARSTPPNYRARRPARASAPASAASASSSPSASTTPTTPPKPARRSRASPSCS